VTAATRLVIQRLKDNATACEQRATSPNLDQYTKGFYDGEAFAYDQTATLLTHTLGEVDLAVHAGILEKLLADLAQRKLKLP
jgi:hypothetical protein